MSHLTFDTTICGQLSGVTEPIEIRDPSGKLIGRFIPVVDMSEWVPLSPGVSEEELDRRANSNSKRYSTAEVLKHLESL